MHFNYDFNLIFYLGGLIFFLYIFISKKKARPKDEMPMVLRKAIEKRKLMLPNLRDEVNEMIGDKKGKEWPLK